VEVLKNKRNLAGSGVKLSIEARGIRKELVPYVNDKKKVGKWGH
jgi:hypothetical protein